MKLLRSISKTKIPPTIPLFFHIYFLNRSQQAIWNTTKILIDNMTDIGYFGLNLFLGGIT